MNQNIIENFQKLIKFIHITNINESDLKKSQINKFRILKLKKVLKILKNISFDIVNSDQLKNIPNVGKSSLKRIQEIIDNGSLSELDSYDDIIEKNKLIEQSVISLTKVIGIGPSIALKLINKYNIKSIEDLKKLNQQNISIKLNKQIQLGLKYFGKFEGRIPHSEISIIYDYVQQLTDSFDSEMFITICGSYRRNLPTSSDIDILLCGFNLISVVPENLLKSYVQFLHMNTFLVDDITTKGNSKYMGFCRLNLSHPVRRIDIRLVPIESYWPALLYFTGSFEFNQKMRSHAKKLGYKLNEYGLFKTSDTNNPIIVLSEQEIFDILGLKYQSPDLRF
jgi:ribosomal protein S13